jgi:hypothetical protein
MSSVTLMILGDSLEPSVVTKLLGMRPNQHWRRGEQKSSRRKDGTVHLFDSVHEWGGWKRWSSNAEQKKDFEALLDHWCCRLTPKKRALARIRASGSEVFLDCFLIGEGSEFALPPHLLAKLGALGVTLRAAFSHHEERPNKALQPTPMQSTPPAGRVAELGSLAAESMSLTLAKILGPWQQPAFESGLIARCRDAWDKPLESLSRLELVTFLKQDFAADHVMPVAKKRLQDALDDDSEMFEGQLAEAVADAEKKKANQSSQPTSLTRRG